MSVQQRSRRPTGAVTANLVSSQDCNSGLHREDVQSNAVQYWWTEREAGFASPRQSDAGNISETRSKAGGVNHVTQDPLSRLVKYELVRASCFQNGSDAEAEELSSQKEDYIKSVV